MIAGCLFALVGYQIILFGLFAKIYGVHHGREKRDRITEFISKHITLRRSVTVGLALFLAGFIFTLRLLLNWIESGYKDLPVLDQDIAAYSLYILIAWRR
jgi:hypothetical protein